MQFGPNRFGKTGDVGFRRRINRKAGDRQEACRGADVENRAALLRDHSGKKQSRQQRQRRDIHGQHFFHALDLARRKGADIAEPGVVDEKIDRDFFAFEPIAQFDDRALIRQIGFPKVDIQVRIASREFVAEFFQPLRRRATRTSETARPAS